jgi:short-subunit dehydrogenase
MKVVLITGASSGIGRATALELASPEITLILVARRLELLEALEAEVRQIGGAATSIQADLSVPGNVDRMIDCALERHGKIDVLINNAAVGYFGTVANMSREVMGEILALNFTAPVIAIQRVLPVMKAEGRGHIINVSSVVGKRGLPLSGIYCASKFALGGISESLRVELREEDIHVSLVYPVATETDFFDAVHRGDVKGEFSPVGYVQPARDVAKAIARCIRRPRAEVYPYRRTRLLVWFNALFPTVIDRVMTSYVRERLRAGPK